MNMRVTVVVSFLVGVGVGVAGSASFLKKKYELLSQEEIAEIREYFTTRLHELEDDDQILVEDDSNNEDGLPVLERHDPRAHLVRSSLSSVIGNQYETAKRDYNLISTPQDEPGPNVKKSSKKKPKQADEQIEEKDGSDIDRDKPYIIDDIQYAEEHSEFSKIGLYYYADGILCDESENLVDDVIGTIGDAAEEYLRHFGTTQLYVRNESIGADYEILVMTQNFGDIHEMTHQEHPPRRRKASEEQ